MSLEWIGHWKLLEIENDTELNIDEAKIETKVMMAKQNMTIPERILNRL